jgi:hypothetical protein
VRHSLQRARQGRPRAGARLDQSAGAVTSIQSEMLRLQRLVGNGVVANLIAGGRIQRRPSKDRGSSVGVRNEATFPASLLVSGSLLCTGETTIGGSTVAGALSASDTLDVGGSVVVNGPISVGIVEAPVIVRKGQPSPNQSSDASGRVDRFSTGEATPRSGFTTGEATPNSGFPTGEATPSTGISEGEAPQSTSTTEDEQPAPEGSSSFGTLVVRKSLTVAGNLNAGSARLGSPTTIGGSLSVGALRVGTLRAGGTVVVSGPLIDVGQEAAAKIAGNQTRVNDGSTASSRGSDDSEESSD